MSLVALDFSGRCCCFVDVVVTVRALPFKQTVQFNLNNILLWL